MIGIHTSITITEREALMIASVFSCGGALHTFVTDGTIDRALRAEVGELIADIKPYGYGASHGAVLARLHAFVQCTHDRGPVSYWARYDWTQLEQDALIAKYEDTARDHALANFFKRIGA